MDNPQTILNPVIKQIAEHYGFSIVFDTELEKWIVSKSESYNGPSFYWNSTMTVNDFLDNLKDYFTECGEPRHW